MTLEMRAVASGSIQKADGAGPTDPGRDGSRTSRLVSAIQSFRRDCRGIAAVEFGFIAPVMLVMLLGAMEVTRAISVDKRFSLVTSMIADLVAREEELTSDDVKAIYDVAEQVMAPFDVAPLKISIIPVMSSPTDASNTLVYPGVTNRPSYNGGAVPAKCQSYALADGLLEKNESVIVIEATYNFTPMFAGYLVDGISWSDKAIAKPRKSLCVAFDGSTCTTNCFP